MNRNARERSDESWFFQVVAEARNRLLLIEYEGILAPSSTNHECASPYPGIADRLIRIMKDCGTEVIVVSGRTVHEVGGRLGMSVVHEIWGGDGLEQLSRDGRYQCTPLNIPADAFEALAECESILWREGLGKFVRINLASVSVHWRGLSDLDDILDVRTRTCRVFKPLSIKHPTLCLMELEGGLELRLRGATKADSLRRLLSATPTETAVVFIGEDRAYKEAFSVLNDRDLAFAVRLLPRIASSVHVNAKPADEVIRFLDDWIRVCSGA